MGYYEFFTRALKPGVHYVEVDPDNLCDDLVSKVSHSLICLLVQLHLQACLPKHTASFACCLANGQHTGLLVTQHIVGIWSCED